VSEPPQVDFSRLFLEFLTLADIIQLGECVLAADSKGFNPALEGFRMDVEEALTASAFWPLSSSRGAASARQRGDHRSV
jgi:hypothetical protein